MGVDDVRDCGVYQLDQSDHPGIRLSLHLLPEAQHYRGHGNEVISVSNEYAVY
jgi:hypothetical protein